MGTPLLTFRWTSASHSLDIVSNLRTITVTDGQRGADVTIDVSTPPAVVARGADVTMEGLGVAGDRVGIQAIVEVDATDQQTDTSGSYRVEFVVDAAGDTSTGTVAFAKGFGKGR